MTARSDLLRLSFVPGPEVGPPGHALPASRYVGLLNASGLLPSMQGTPPVRTAVEQPTSMYIGLLEARGFHQLRMVGLRSFGLLFFDGSQADEFVVPVDCDAQLLLDYYLTLEESVTRGAHAQLTSYLGNGVLEVTAILEGPTVNSIVGVFGEGGAKRPELGKLLPVRQYLEAWRNVARQLVSAARG